MFLPDGHGGEWRDYGITTVGLAMVSRKDCSDKRTFLPAATIRNETELRNS